MKTWLKQLYLCSPHLKEEYDTYSARDASGREIKFLKRVVKCWQISLLTLEAPSDEKEFLKITSSIKTLLMTEANDLIITVENVLHRLLFTSDREEDTK